MGKLMLEAEDQHEDIKRYAPHVFDIADGVTNTGEVKSGRESHVLCGAANATAGGSDDAAAGNDEPRQSPLWPAEFHALTPLATFRSFSRDILFPNVTGSLF